MPTAACFLSFLTFRFKKDGQWSYLSLGYKDVSLHLCMMGCDVSSSEIGTSKLSVFK